MFVKWQNHVYDFEIMIWNHGSDLGKSNAPLLDARQRARVFEALPTKKELRLWLLQSKEELGEFTLMVATNQKDQRF